MGTQEITLAVASDLHYLSSSLRDNGEAFSLMTRFSDGALTMYGDEIFDAFISEIDGLHPDALLITGDLTFNGEKKSHRYLAKGFRRLWRSGIPVILIPGNHDIENPMAGSYTGSEARPARSVTKEQFCRIYSVPMLNDEYFSLRDPSSLSFVCAPADGLLLLCLDVNGNGSPGAVTDAELSWAEAVLEKTSGSDVRVISVTHQNLLAHNGLFSEGYVIKNAKSLMSLFHDYGVHLNLSGHMHIQHIKEENGMCEIVTSALMIPPCQYGILTVTGDTAEYHSKVLDVAAWAEKEKSSDRNLMNFSSFAASFYLDTQERMVTASLEGETLSPDDKDILIKSMAALNQSFFAGNLSTMNGRDQIRSLWREKLPGNFWNDYMDSIFDEGIKDEQNVRVSLR